MGRAGLNKREALGKVVIAWSPKRVAQLHIPLFQLCKSTGQKRQNWYVLAAYTSGGSYVINFFKQKIVSQKNDIFTTVRLQNNLFCRIPSDHLHCTNRLLRYVFRKHVYTRPVTSLGHQEGRKSFLRGAQIFWTMSNNFKRCPTHFSRGGRKFLSGGLAPLNPPWLCAWSTLCRRWKRRRFRKFSTKYHAKATWTVLLAWSCRWQLYNSYAPWLFRDLVNNSALFDLRLIPSRSRQALRN